MKKLFLIALLFPVFSCISQSTELFKENFEDGLTAFDIIGGSETNSWITNECAGNGTTESGTYAAYVSNLGGSTDDCTATGTLQYAYDNSISTTDRTAGVFHVDASCTGNLSLEFDYRIEGISTEDYGAVVYSTDGGISWTTLVAELGSSATWTSTSIPLPALLNNTTFEIGFEFYYNDNTINGVPLAIDNIFVFGDDATPPSLICAASANAYVDTNCDGICPNLASAILNLSDNCTDSTSMGYSQSVPEGGILLEGVGQNLDITVTVEDNAGNQAQCVVNVIVVDTIRPILTCPLDTNVILDNSCASVMGDYSVDLVASDNCTSPLNLIINQSPAPGFALNGQGISTVVTFEVIDESGNLQNCSFSVEHIDTILPVITCPDNQIVYANASCEGTLDDYTGLAVFSDNCISSGLLSVTQSPNPGTLVTDTTLITLTLNGGVPGPEPSCIFEAVWIDTLVPSVICPADMDAYADVNCEVLVPDFSAGVIVSDNCYSAGSMVYSQNPNPGAVISDTTVVNISFTDPFGNVGVCSTMIHVIDTIKPIISCPSDMDASTDVNCLVVIPDYTALAVATDNCTSVANLNFSQNPIGTSINTPTLITLTVEDESGNNRTCQFTITPMDDLAPSITCPETQTLATTTACTADIGDYRSLATAVDNCSAAGNLIFVQNPPSGTNLPSGSNLIEITVEDENANTNSCTFTLSIVDGTAPIANTCPGTQFETAGAGCSGVLGDYTGLVAATDNCDSPAQLVFTQSPLPGSTFVANEDITITISDQGGNSTQCYFTVLATDNLDPQVTCPSDQQIAIDANCDYLIPDFSGDVSGSDNCSLFDNMTIAQLPTAGSTGNSNTTVFLTLTDEQGNQATCSFNLTPIDMIAPQITCPSPAPVNNGISCDYVLPFYGTMAPVLDNCSDYSITQNPPQGTTIQTGITTIELTVTDAGGNQAACSFDLTVNETQLPSLSCPSDIISCDPVVSYTLPSYSDNCAVDLVQTDASSLSSGSTFPVGFTIQQYSAIDLSGNESTCQFSIQVLEYAADANIALDTLKQCDGDAILITADEPNSGSGEWTVISGSGNFNNAFAFETGVNNVGLGENKFVWTVSSPSCGSNSDTLVVVIYQAPVPVNVPDTLNICNDGFINLMTTTPLVGTGTWSSNQGISFANPNASVTTATTIPDGWSQIAWTVTNNGCPSESDTIQVFSSANAGIITADTSFCWDNSPTLQLQGTPLTAEQSGAWSFSMGSGSFSSYSGSSSSVSAVQLGENRIVYTVTTNNCPTQVDTLVVITHQCENFEPVFPTVITPNMDGKNDLFVVDHLEILYPECLVQIFNRWGSVVFESTGYEDPWDGTHNGEKLPMGTYFFKIQLMDDNNTEFTGPISIIH